MPHPEMGLACHFKLATQLQLKSGPGSSKSIGRPWLQRRPFLEVRANHKHRVLAFRRAPEALGRGHSAYGQCFSVAILSRPNEAGQISDFQPVGICDVSEGEERDGRAIGSTSAGIVVGIDVGSLRLVNVMGATRMVLRFRISEVDTVRTECQRRANPR